ncbi:MAG: phenylalanine--tRNA ligase subunit alpha [Thermodesulfobacteriota bacterium]
MLDTLKDLENKAKKDLGSAIDREGIFRVKTNLLGRKGELTLVLRGLGSLPSEERASAGKLANEVKKKIEAWVDSRLQEVLKKERELNLKAEQIDVTLPGRNVPFGKKHPLTQIQEEIVEIFFALGFEVAGGPEIETDHYNFESLNIPKDHPARDMQDTFYLNDDFLLRTHTSPVQIRVMEKTPPPVRIIAPGTAYRRDSDISHTPMFHQVEGLMVDEGVTFGDLKGMLTIFLHQMFGKETALRFRPSFFPFTEPSAEVDIQCLICKGEGCRVCKGVGWLEILGSGMVNPAVLCMVGYDPEVVSGFAFGMGIERIAMLKLGVNDMRLFFENDVRFLNQF